MESTLATLLPVFLRVTNLDFFAYETNGFIHIADIDFIDRFSYFATEKSLIFGEGARTIRQEIYKSLVGFCLSKLHPESEDLYEQCKVKPSSDAKVKILSNRTPKNAFFESARFFKKNCEGV